MLVLLVEFLTPLTLRDDFTYLFVRHHLLKKTKILQNRLSRKEYEKTKLKKKCTQKCETQHKTIKSELGADLLSSPTLSLLSKLIERKKQRQYRGLQSKA